MRAVNLLPARHRPRTPTGEQQGSAYVLVGILGVVLVMVVFYVLTVNGINTRKGKVVSANAETMSAENRANALRPYGDFSQVKDERVRAVRELATSRIDWERLARGLARVLPTDVWLTSASANASGTPASTGGSSAPAPTPGGTTSAGPQVALSGCAPSQSAVAVTLVRLRELSGAQDVQLIGITRPEQASGPAAPGSSAPASSGASGDCGTVHGSPAVKWDATVIFNQSASTASQPVPKSLGGGA